MIEKKIREYLKTILDIPVYLEEPETIPDEYIIVEKVGSGLRNHIKSAMIAVQSYSTSLSKTIDLNEMAKTAMLEAITEPYITKVSLNSDYNFTDTETKRYRYQAMFDVTFY